LTLQRKGKLLHRLKSVKIKMEKSQLTNPALSACGGVFHCCGCGNSTGLWWTVLFLLVHYFIVMGLVITNVKPGSDQLDEPDTSDMADPSCSFNQRCKSTCATQFNSAGFSQNRWPTVIKDSVLGCWKMKKERYEGLWTEAHAQDGGRWPQ
jgi:hypothetical protein